MVKVKFKKLVSHAVIPVKAHADDACMDMYAVDAQMDDKDNLVLKTGLAMELPEGFCALLFSRSSVAKSPFILTNCVGVIDAGYRGEIMLKYKNIKTDWTTPQDIDTFTDKAICQMMIIPVLDIEIEEVDELGETERGEGGFGSTDAK